MIFIHRYRKLQQEKEDKIYEMIDQRMTAIDQKLIILNSGMDSLKIQQDSIKTAQYEVIETNKQAKNQADRALSAYRDIVLSLPEL